jgi:formylglycine-generating enzyme required for sulfatase activity/serine/threonine protein kinase
MSTAADPTAAFLAALRQAPLLGPAQLDQLAVWVAQNRPDVPGLAKELNRRGWLTPYQIREVHRGRSKDLVLGPYVLLDLLGEGGMGRVYKARQTRLGRDVALKVIRQQKLTHPAARGRFQQEVRAHGQLHHPNVVTAYDADQVGELHFVVMEYIDGTDLAKIVRARGPLPVPEACEYIRQAALGLEHAHEMGLVHRDIKPSNILVSRDGRQVKLVDLGLARVIEDAPAGEAAGRLTQDGFVIGTPDFLAPEQARNPSGVDIRADVYALGGTLYFLLTGKVPYDGANPTEKLVKHCTDPPPRLLDRRPDAPPELDRVIQWCMAKRPEDRPQTPLQLAVALQPFCPPSVAGSGVVGVPGMPAVPLAARRIPPAAPPGDLRPPARQDLRPPARPDLPPAETFPLDLPNGDPAPGGPALAAPARAAGDRGRSSGGFPLGPVLVASGGLLLLGVLALAAYRAFQPGTPPPVETFTNTLGMRMVRLDGGVFTMGSPDDEPGRPQGDEGPAHEVTVRGPFLVSATEVTNGQYLKVMGSTPARAAGRAASAADLPVERVTYDEALEFCRKLTEKERGQKWARPGWTYRLPTEAEWEYACRAGTDTPYSFGSQLVSQRQARFNPGDGAFAADQADLPNRVGQCDPNPWGLYDMHGNVAEWCLDWYRRGYPGGAARDNPLGPPDGDRRVVRGGSFRQPAEECRSAARMGLRPNERRDSVGFRVVYAPVLR